MKKRGISDVDPGKVDVISLRDPRLEAVERSLDVAMALGGPSSGPRFPWETNPFLRDVLGPPEVPWLKPPAMMRSMNYVPSTLQPVRAKMTVPERKAQVRHTVHQHVSQAADQARSSLLLKWAELFMIMPEDTLPGKMLLECADDELKVMTTLNDLSSQRRHLHSGHE